MKWIGLALLPFLGGCFGSHPEAVRANNEIIVQGLRHADRNGLEPNSDQVATMIRSAEINGAYLGLPEQAVQLNFRNKDALARQTGGIQSGAAQEAGREGSRRELAGALKDAANGAATGVSELILPGSSVLLALLSAFLGKKLKDKNQARNVLVASIEELKARLENGEFIQASGMEARAKVGEVISAQASRKNVTKKVRKEVEAAKAINEGAS